MSWPSWSRVCDPDFKFSTILLSCRYLFCLVAVDLCFYSSFCIFSLMNMNMVYATQWKRPSCDFRGLSWELTRDKVETERQQISFTWFREISKLKSWESWNSFFNSFDSTSLKSFAGLRRMWCHYTLQCSPEWGWKPCVLIFISWICRKALA